MECCCCQQEEEHSESIVESIVVGNMVTDHHKADCANQPRDIVCDEDVADEDEVEVKHRLPMSRLASRPGHAKLLASAHRRLQLTRPSMVQLPLSVRECINEPQGPCLALPSHLHDHSRHREEPFVARSMNNDDLEEASHDIWCEVSVSTSDEVLDEGPHLRFCETSSDTSCGTSETGAGVPRQAEPQRNACQQRVAVEVQSPLPIHHPLAYACKAEPQRNAFQKRVAVEVQSPLPIRHPHAYAFKVWVLLVVQLFGTFVITVALEAYSPQIVSSLTRVVIWVISVLVLLLLVSLLHMILISCTVNSKHLLGVTLITGAFWGLTHYISDGHFSAQVTGVAAYAALLSAVACGMGWMESLASHMTPPVKSTPKDVPATDHQASSLERPQSPKQDTNDAQKENTCSGKELPVPEITDTPVTTTIDHRMCAAMRAAMLVGFIAWAVAFIFNVTVVCLLSQLDVPNEITVAAGAVSFSLTMFIHWDLEMQMRRCNPEDCLRPVVQVNIDVFACIASLCRAANMAISRSDGRSPA